VSKISNVLFTELRTAAFADWLILFTGQTANLDQIDDSSVRNLSKLSDGLVTEQWFNWTIRLSGSEPKKHEVFNQLGILGLAPDLSKWQHQLTHVRTKRQ